MSNSFVTVARQAPLSMRFPRQEDWSGLPFPPPGDLLNPGINPASPAWQADSLPLSPREPPHTASAYLIRQHSCRRSWGEIIAGEFHVDVASSFLKLVLPLCAG